MNRNLMLKLLIFAVCSCSHVDASTPYPSYGGYVSSLNTEDMLALLECFRSEDFDGKPATGDALTVWQDLEKRTRKEEEKRQQMHNNFRLVQEMNAETKKQSNSASDEESYVICTKEEVEALYKDCDATQEK